MLNKHKIKAIGGFFELELPRRDINFHQGSIALTNGRACLSLIIEIEKPKLIYVPYYTCYALFEPIEKLDINIIFYSIDSNLNPINLPILDKDDLFIYINYFGLKDDTCKSLIKKYNKKVVIDNTHSFFHKEYNNIYSFTSARKYFGVADGAYLYGATDYNIERIERNNNVSIECNVERLKGNQDIAYNLYQNAESKFSYTIERISNISEEILKTIDYDFISKKRIENYNYLNTELSKYNKLQLRLDKNIVPFCYPLLPSLQINKADFHKEQIYIPTLWPDILTRNNHIFDFENKFTNDLLPLPIDHRYTIEDMQRIINFIKGKINDR